MRAGGRASQWVDRVVDRSSAELLRLGRYRLLVVMSRAIPTRTGGGGKSSPRVVAMIDRLVHHVEVVSVRGDSSRLQDQDLDRPSNATNDDQDQPRPN